MIERERFIFKLHKYLREKKHFLELLQRDFIIIVCLNTGLL
jgi:hypothetical protein